MSSSLLLIMNIKYKISKELLVLQVIASFLPLGVFVFCLLNISKNSPILYIVFSYLFLLVLLVCCISFYFIFQRLWNKVYLYTQKDRSYFYDCLKAKYVEVKIADIGGINDYNLSIYPYSILIIYTNNGKIFTCPDLAEGGKDIISERIYEIIYQTGSDSD